MVERDAEPAIDLGLRRMLAGAVFGDRQSGLQRGQLGRRAVFIGAADEQHVAPLQALEPGIDVGRQDGAGEVADVLDAVHVRQRRCDEDTVGHDGNSGQRPEARR